ncbi:MAG: hypothetical protein WD228_00965 [Mycobacterium sp.]
MNQTSDIRHQGAGALLAGSVRKLSLVTQVPGNNRYRLTSDGLRSAVFYTKVHDRLLRPLGGTDQSPAPPLIRKALQNMSIHITEMMGQDHILSHAALKTQDSS